MNKTKKVSLISLGIALAVTPLAIYAVRKVRGRLKEGCCDMEEDTDDGRKHLFGGLKNKRGNRDAENMEA